MESNSDRARNEKEQEKSNATQVVDGSKVKTRKKSGASKFADVFVSEDVDTVKHYIFTDVLVPAIKDAISKVIKTGIDMLLYGDSRASSNRTPYREYYTDYRTTARPVRQDQATRYSSRRNRLAEMEELEFETRGDASLVLDELYDILDNYGTVTVNDMYSAAGLPCDYTYSRYGWSDLRTATLHRTFDGRYVLRMPRPIQLD